MADQKKTAPQDDKSINDLLQEYADDVKDKDLDDFLKDGDDDAFETEASEAVEDDGDDVAPVPESGGRSIGFGGGLLILLLLAGAGAGAYMYVAGRDGGVTQIMGGFKGADPSFDDTAVAAPVAPDQAPVLPSPAPQVAEDMPAQPAPIANESPAMGSEEVFPAAELEKRVAEEDQSPAQTKPVMSADEAAAAVDKWAAEIGVQGEKKEDLPEQTVEEVKAKPPVTASVSATPKVEKVEKAEAAPAPAKAETPAKIEEAPAPVKTVAKAAPSPLDEALPPPYLAIQAQKGGAAPVPQPAATSMAPVMDETKPAPAAPAEVATRNLNEADVTSATGAYREMVVGGGGKIEIEGSKTSFVSADQPAAMQSAPQPQPAAIPAVVPAPAAVMQSPAPQMAMPVVPVAPVVTAPTASNNYPAMPALAINGGKSLPPESGDQPADPRPVVDMLVSAPAPAFVAVPPSTTPDSAPLVEEKMVVTPAVPQQPVASVAAVPATAPAADAKSVLDQAVALEKAGNPAAALPLYQRALELDAIYADGKSIDRNFVYDRIGAIRAATGGR